MDLFYETLNKSCQHYHHLHNEIVAAVELAQNGNFEEATISISKVNALLTQIKAIDKELYSLADEQKIRSHFDMWEKRTNLMSTTLDFHNENYPHMLSIMAMKRDQIQKIRGGRRGLSGYHTGVSDTGKFVKNAT